MSIFLRENGDKDNMASKEKFIKAKKKKKKKKAQFSGN